MLCHLQLAEETPRDTRHSPLSTQQPLRQWRQGFERRQPSYGKRYEPGISKLNIKQPGEISGSRGE
jgi:hypothetical protein